MESVDIPDLTAVALLRHLPLNTKRLLDFCMKVSLQRINFLNDQDSYQFLAINISCQFLANGHESQIIYINFEIFKFPSVSVCDRTANQISFICLDNFILGIYPEMDMLNRIMWKCFVLSGISLHCLKILRSVK